MPSPIAITGATGFIGRRLLDVLTARKNVGIRVMSRYPEASKHFSWISSVVRGDLRDPNAFARILEPGCTWINLAHPDLRSQVEHLEVMSSLIRICRERKVRRVIHCSTATVVGRSHEGVITEATECEPGNQYEATKLAIERCLLEKGADFMEVAVLRPTAVFGPHGRNLLKLACDLKRRPALVNYLKSCLQGTRRMNLVHVDNVVAALAFLLDGTDGIVRETFIISDDESLFNNYREVERQLMIGLDIPDYPLAPARAPYWVLSTALRAAGRTNVNPNRTYDCSKIVGRGLKKPVCFEEGLADFIAWYRSREPAQAA